MGWEGVGEGGLVQDGGILGRGCAPTCDHCCCSYIGALQ